MRNRLETITKLEFPPLSPGLDEALESVFEAISLGQEEIEKKLLRNDFDFYREKGKWLVHNTFAGGIIFLREPEEVTKVRMDFCTLRNEVVVQATFASEVRNARNVKYKPDAGKVEQIIWNLMGVFPNFSKYSPSVKLLLIAIIGRIVKDTCEHYRKNSWFMKYSKPFELELLMEGKTELTYTVEVV